MVIAQSISVSNILEIPSSYFMIDVVCFLFCSVHLPKVVVSLGLTVQPKGNSTSSSWSGTPPSTHSYVNKKMGGDYSRTHRPRMAARSKVGSNVISWLGSAPFNNINNNINNNNNNILIIAGIGTRYKLGRRAWMLNGLLQYLPHLSSCKRR